MALHGKTPGKIRDAVKELKPFRIGNVSGTTEFAGVGRLPETFAHNLEALARAGRVKYVLYSYATPMAWLEDHSGRDLWVQPNVKYSVSTTNHQSTFASAIRAREESK